MCRDHALDKNLNSNLSVHLVGLATYRDLLLRNKELTTISDDEIWPNDLASPRLALTDDLLPKSRIAGRAIPQPAI